MCYHRTCGINATYPTACPNLGGGGIVPTHLQYQESYIQFVSDSLTGSYISLRIQACNGLCGVYSTCATIAWKSAISISTYSKTFKVEAWLTYVMLIPVARKKQLAFQEPEWLEAINDILVTEPL